VIAHFQNERMPNPAIVYLQYDLQSYGSQLSEEKKSEISLPVDFLQIFNHKKAQILTHTVLSTA